MKNKGDKINLPAFQILVFKLKEEECKNDIRLDK